MLTRLESSLTEIRTEGGSSSHFSDFPCLVPDVSMLLSPTLGGHTVPLDLTLLILFSVDLPVILIVYSSLQSLVLNLVLCLATFCYLAKSCVQLCPSLSAPLMFTYLGKILIYYIWLCHHDATEYLRTTVGNNSFVHLANLLKFCEVWSLHIYAPAF